MRTVLISIRPEWCNKILSGEKTVEIRKTKPKLETPFKCYIYMTKQSKPYTREKSEYRFDGRVIAEFICDNIKDITRPGWLVKEDVERILQGTCLSRQQLIEYANWKEKDTVVYGWHISKLKIYDKPRYTSEFTLLRKTKFGYEPVTMEKAPQSWCYVKELEQYSASNELVLNKLKE